MTPIYPVYGYKIPTSLSNGRKPPIRPTNLLVTDHNKGTAVVYIPNIRIIENKTPITGEILSAKNNDGIAFEYKFPISERIAKCIIIAAAISATPPNIPPQIASFLLAALAPNPVKNAITTIVL